MKGRGEGMGNQCAGWSVQGTDVAERTGALSGEALGIYLREGMVLKCCSNLIAVRNGAHLLNFQSCCVGRCAGSSG